MPVPMLVPAGQRKPDCCYVKWHEIEFHTVARRGQSNPIPGASTSSQISGFPYRLATIRSESSHFRKRLYSALNSVDMRCRLQNDRHFRLLATFSYHIPRIPKPMQANIFVTWARAVQPMEQVLRNEVNNWAANQPNTQAIVQALHDALQQTFATTLIGS